MELLDKLNNLNLKSWVLGYDVLIHSSPYFVIIDHGDIRCMGRSLQEAVAKAIEQCELKHLSLKSEVGDFIDGTLHINTEYGETLV